MIHSSFQTPITFRIPQLFRYTDKEYVSAFFSDGALRLGSLQSYRNDTHDERKDEQEGAAQLHGILNPGFLHTKLTIPENAYILCTSSINSKSLMDKFGVDGAFVISDPLAFANQIARCIPGVQGVMIGECNYNFPLTQYLPNENIGNIGSLNQIQKNKVTKDVLGKALGVEPYFHKPAKYIDQSEYRFVFITDRKANDYIDIISPAAQTYCMEIKHSSTA